MSIQKNQDNQNSFDRENVEGLTLPSFNIYYKATVTKTLWYQQKPRQYQQSRTEGTEKGAK